MQYAVKSRQSNNCFSSYVNQFHVETHVGYYTNILRIVVKNNKKQLTSIENAPLLKTFSILIAF